MNATLSMAIDKIKWPFSTSAADTRLFDRVLMILVILMLTFGVLMVTSSSLPFALERTGNSFYFLYRHLFYMSIGFAGAAVVLSRPSDSWQKWSVHLLVICLVMLVLVLILGREVNGAKRWLGAGGFTIQVSELAKLFVIIYLADLSLIHI